MNRKSINSGVLLMLVCMLGLIQFAIGADEPPSSFDIPVYVDTEQEIKDGKVFELKIIGNQYQNPSKTSYEGESLEGNTVNTFFQGYADSSRNLATGTQLQISMDGVPITLPPITELQNSGTKNFDVPGTPYTVVLAFSKVSGNFFTGTSDHYNVGIKKVINKDLKEEPASAEFPIPVYIGKPETKDGKVFEIRLTGNQYTSPESTRKIESFEGKPFNLTFQGYANSSLNLATGDQIQMFVDGVASTLSTPITPLQNSGIRDIIITGTPYIITIAYKYTAPFLGFGQDYFALGIKDIIINQDIKDFQEKMPQVSREASDLLRRVKTELEDKIISIPEPNQEIIQQKNGINKQITTLKNTLTAIVAENSKFPFLSEEGKQYLVTSQESLTKAPLTINQLKQDLQTLSSIADTAVAEAKARTEAQQRAAIKNSC
jgi:hypothetical protein